MRHRRLLRSVRSVALVLLLSSLLVAPGRAAWKIVDPDGEPVADAVVELHLRPSSSEPLAALRAASRRAISDHGGRVELPLPSADALLLVDHPRFAPWTLELGPTTPRPEVVRLGRGEVLRGRIRAAPKADGAAMSAGPGDGDGRVCATWTGVWEPRGWRRPWIRCVALGGDSGPGQVPEALEPSHGPVAGDGASQPRWEFVLAGLPDHSVDLLVEVDGFLPASRSVRPGDPPSGSALEIVVEPGVLLAGRVVGPAGEGLRGAEVRAVRAIRRPGGSSASRRPGAASPGGVEADVQGGFALPVSELPILLEATAPGYHPTRRRVEASPTEDEPLVLTLRPAERVGGLVSTSEGLPAPGARVAWERSLGSGWERGESRPVEEGSFLLDLPGPGVYALALSAADHRNQRIDGLTVGAGETIDVGVIVLSTGGGVRGTVLDAGTGEPVEGVEMGLWPLGTTLLGAGGGSIPSAATDDRGRFSIVGLDGGRFELRATHGDYALHRRDVTVTRDRVEELDPLHLDTGTRIDGRLVDRSGEPRAGLVVRFFEPEQSALVALVERTSDDRGRFGDLDLAPGRYRVTVTGDRLLLAQELEVPEDTPEMAVELIVGGVELVGRVHRGREPVTGGRLTFASALDPARARGKVLLHDPARGATATYGLAQTALSAPVEMDGTFRLEDAPTGLLRVTYRGSDGEVVHREIQVPDRRQALVDIDLAGHALQGRVIDGRSNPLSGARVGVLDATGRMVGEAWTDDAGRFRVPDLVPDTYRLEVRADGHRSRTLAGISVPDGAVPMEIVLEPGGDGRLSVQLVRSDGSPLGSSQVSLLDASGRMVRSLPTDHGGTRLFEQLPAGEYFVVWSDPVAGVGHSPLQRVDGGELETWSATLAPGGGLRLVCRLESCSGAPVSLLTVHSSVGLPLDPYLSGLSAGLRFSEAGELTLGRLAPGHYRVALWVGERRMERSATVDSGIETFLVVPWGRPDFPAASCSVPSEVPSRSLPGSKEPGPHPSSSSTA